MKPAMIHTQGTTETGAHPTISSISNRNTDSEEEKIYMFIYLTTASVIHGKSEYIDLQTAWILCYECFLGWQMKYVTP